MRANCASRPGVCLARRPFQQWLKGRRASPSRRRPRFSNGYRPTRREPDIIGTIMTGAKWKSRVDGPIHSNTIFSSAAPERVSVPWGVWALSRHFQILVPSKRKQRMATVRKDHLNIRPQRAISKR
jgi:hypothetical protein